MQHHVQSDLVDQELGKELGSLPAPLKKRGRVFAKIIIQCILMVLVILAALFVTQKLMGSSTKVSVSKPAKVLFPVASQIVKKGVESPFIHAFGQIVAGNVLELRPLAAGEVLAIHPSLKVGALVNKGDMLVAIDPFSAQGAVTEAKANLAQTQGAILEISERLDQEHNQLLAAQNQLELAQNDLKRASTLAKSGSITSKGLEDRKLIVSQRQQSVSQRKANLKIENARLDQQNATLQRLNWRLNQATRNLRDTKLYAPFSGVVREVKLALGKHVGANEIVATIYDNNELEAKFSITNAQYGRLASDREPLIGRKIQVIWQIGGEDILYTGKIVRLDAIIESERGGVSLFAMLNVEGKDVQLRPGAFVEIIIPDKSYEQAIRIPETAVYQGDTVFAIEDGVLKPRKVKVRGYSDGMAIITGTVENGDRVMTTRLAKAYGGLSVSVLDEVAVDGASSPTQSSNTNE